MDDAMENEIICELFSTHAHIVWRYLGVTSAGLAELLLPGPGESYKTKMFQPGPFMFLMFLAIVASVSLQSSSSWLRQVLFKTLHVVGLKSITDNGFKALANLDLNSPLASENITWYYKNGIVGIYGLQGRRGNMEDRYCVMQDVDVGESKKISFFGVYDGHGGQFTAEFVKQNLFKNTIEKIRQLRSQIQTVGNKTHYEKVNNKLSGQINKKIEKNEKIDKLEHKSPISGTDTKEQLDMKEAENSNVISDDNSAVMAKILTNPLNRESSKEVSSCPIESRETSSTEINDDSELILKGSSVENVSRLTSGILPGNFDPSKVLSEGSLKKDDTYASIKLKKSNSLKGSCTDGKDKKEDNPDLLYIDAYKNINYTRLLTDQIISVDKQVIEQCKTKTDMSGTTAVIAILDGELLIIGNVGDSRAVMGDISGSTIPLSFDHKPNQLKERRRIKEAGGFITFSGVWRVAGILATSRALGDFPLKEPRHLVTAEPDILTFSLRDHKAHFVILATDGLWDVLTNEEAVAFIRDHINESDYGAKSLSIYAYNRGSQDNITVAVLNFAKLNLNG